MIPPFLIKLGVRFMFKKFLESKFIKGKLSWSGVAAFAAMMINAKYGVDLGPQFTLIAQGVAALVTVAGVARKIYQAQKGI